MFVVFCSLYTFDLCTNSWEASNPVLSIERRNPLGFTGRLEVCALVYIVLARAKMDNFVKIYKHLNMILDGIKF